MSSTEFYGQPVTNFYTSNIQNPEGYFKLSPEELIEGAEEIKNNQSLARNTLISSVTENEEGINVERVINFIQAIGLPIAPYVILENASDPKTQETLGTFGYVFDSSIGGLTSNRDQICIINGTTYDAEATLVHELTHGSDRESYRLFHDVDKSLHALQMRVGLSVLGQAGFEGTALEEGRAALVEGAYKENFLPLVPNHVQTPNYFVPPKYLFNSGGVTGFSSSSYVALAVEMLANFDHDIIGSYVDSCTDTNAHRDFARRVDKLVPNLYPTLRRLGEGRPQYEKALGTVISKLYDGDSRAILKIDHTIARNYFDDKMADYEARTGYSFIPDA